MGVMHATHARRADAAHPAAKVQRERGSRDQEQAVASQSLPPQLCTRNADGISNGLTYVTVSTFVRLHRLARWVSGRASGANLEQRRCILLICN